MSRGSKRRERSHPRALPILISAVLFLSGCGMLLYPTLSNWLSNRHQSELYVAYQDQVDELDDGDAEAELERARNYNDQLADQVKLVSDPFRDGNADNAEYDSLLNVTSAGVMGYVEIPSIGVFLPIYHGVNNDILMKGVGHLPETSMPVGGPSTHAVLAAGAEPGCLPACLSSRRRMCFISMCMTGISPIPWIRSKKSPPPIPLSFKSWTVRTM